MTHIHFLQHDILVSAGVFICHFPSGAAGLSAAATTVTAGVGAAAGYVASMVNVTGIF